MCEWNKWGDTRIDPCMKYLIRNLNLSFNDLRTVACCCGHGKYPMTILVKDRFGNVYDLVSCEIINRKRRFYKRDSEGYYYIPETHG
jgi:hypothetical protein